MTSITNTQASLCPELFIIPQDSSHSKCLLDGLPPMTQAIRSVVYKISHPTLDWCCSVAKLCLTLCDPMDCSMPGFPVFHSLSEFDQTQCPSVMASNHLILCHPLLLLPSIFPSIRVFPNESVLRIRWPKYWSFSFSIYPSSEYSGLISFRIDQFVLLAG